MNNSSRRASVNVSLVLIGAAAVASLSGCAKEERRADMRRDVYASREDCIGDWGNSPSDCEPAPAQRSGSHVSGGTGTHYYGRPYVSTDSNIGPRSSKSIGSSSESRGGFGTSGHSASG